jgi:hypothetical protein
MGAFMLTGDRLGKRGGVDSTWDGAAEEAGEAQRPHQDQRHAGAAGDDTDHAAPPRLVNDQERNDGAPDRDGEQRRRERVEPLCRGEIEVSEGEPGAREAAGRAGLAEGEANDAGGVGDEREQRPDHEDRADRAEPPEAPGYARMHGESEARTRLKRRARPPT